MVTIHVWGSIWVLYMGLGDRAIGGKENLVPILSFHSGWG